METLKNQMTEDSNVQNEQVKETYLAPHIEVMEVKVEKGYAASNVPLDDRDYDRW